MSRAQLGGLPNPVWVGIAPLGMSHILGCSRSCSRSSLSCLVRCRLLCGTPGERTLPEQKITQKAYKVSRMPCNAGPTGRGRFGGTKRARIKFRALKHLS